MQETGSAIYSIAKEAGLLSSPHQGIIHMAASGAKHHFMRGDTLAVHPEKLLWIDSFQNIAILAAVLLPRLRHDDFTGRLALGFWLGQTQRQRQYVLAPFDESGALGHITAIHPPIQHAVFGRHGLIGKAFHAATSSEFISHIPHHHDDLRGIIGQVGGFTSPEHLQISFDQPLLRLKDKSEYGTIAYTA